MDNSGLTDASPAKPQAGIRLSARQRAALLGLGMLVLTLAIAAPFFDVPMQRDQGVYAACGSSLLHGGAPYRDCWDTKAPLTHYTYALAQLIFGIDLKGPVILSAIISALTGIVLWRITRRWFGEAIAWGMGLAYALLIVSIPFDMNAQSEGFANLFIALAVLGVLVGFERDSRWALVGAGVSLAFAVGYKYTIILPAGAAVAMTAVMNTPVRDWPRSASRLLPLAISFVATIALFTLYLVARGALSYAFEHIAFMLTQFPKVEVNPVLLLFPGESGPPLFYLQRTWYQFARLPVIHIAGIGGCIVAIFKRRLWAWLLTIWLVASLASVYPQKVMTLYHWTLSLAPLVVGIGALVWELRAQRWAVAVVTVAVAANLGVRFYIDQWLVVEKYLTGQQTKAEFYASQAIGDEIEVADYIKARTTPTDLIWVWGNHSIMYYWSDRLSPTRFIFNSPLMAAIGPNDYQPRWKAEVLDALYAHPPSYIVITYYDRTWFDYENPVDQFAVQPGYQPFLDNYYRKETTIGRFVLFRLTPWWSRYNPPTRLDAITDTDLLTELDSAETFSAPDQPIAITQFALYDEAAQPALLMHPEGSATYSVTLPEGVVCFRADLAMDPQSWGWGGDGATFVLAVNNEKVFDRHLGNTVDDRFWQPVIVDLNQWAGQTVALTLSTGPGPNSDFIGDLAGWGLPRIVQSPGASCEANVIVRD
jgi:4-amino-4-deoxy-L-arabinose transferase-like glycosyltransferase